MAAKTNQNFQIYQGENKQLQMVIDDGASPPVLIDLTGKYFRYRVGDGPDSTTWYIEKLTNVVSIIAVGIAGVIFSHSDTVNLDTGTFYHELRIGDVEDDEIVVMTGTFQLDPSLTNAADPMSS